MSIREQELAETLRKIQELFAKAKAIAEPILQKWKDENHKREIYTLD